MRTKRHLLTQKFLLVSLMMAYMSLASTQPCEPRQDSIQLVVLYNHCNGSNWRLPWDLKEPFHRWLGVEVNDSGCVSELNLGARELICEFPAISLPKLEVLELGPNELHGQIPELRGMPKLRFLRAWHNRLEGNIPDLSYLEELNAIELLDNQLTGGLEEIARLSELEFFSADSNLLQGKIPNLTKMKKLRWIDLSANQLSGPVPDISALDSLRRITLHSNRLEGCVDNRYCDLVGPVLLHDNANLPWQGNLDSICLNNFQIHAPCRIESSTAIILDNCQCGWYDCPEDEEIELQLDKLSFCRTDLPAQLTFSIEDDSFFLQNVETRWIGENISPDGILQNSASEEEHIILEVEKGNCSVTGEFNFSVLANDVSIQSTCVRNTPDSILITWSSNSLAIAHEIAIGESNFTTTDTFLNIPKPKLSNWPFSYAIQPLLNDTMCPSPVLTFTCEQNDLFASPDSLEVIRLHQLSELKLSRLFTDVLDAYACDFTVGIYDLSGREIIKTRDPSTCLDLLSPGYYVCIVRLDQEIKSFKFCVVL